MPVLGPIKRADLIKCLRKFGFDGPYSGGNVTPKLTADRGTQKLLGAQVYGDATVDKVVDTVAAALTGGMTLSDLVNEDVSSREEVKWVISSSGIQRKPSRT